MNTQPQQHKKSSKSPRFADVDYEDKSHTQNQRKAGIRNAFVKKSKEELADTYGFDDCEEISQYERYIK